VGDYGFYLFWIFGSAMTLLLSFFLSKAINYDLRRGFMGACTGLLSGYMYFMVFPLMVLHFNGYYDKPIFEKIYDLPNLDVQMAFPATTYIFACGLILVALFRRGGKENLASSWHTEGRRAVLRFLGVVSVVYMILLAIDVRLSGVLSGDGHWYKSRIDMQAGSQFSVLLVYIKHALVNIIAVILIWSYDKKYINGFSLFTMIVPLVFSVLYIAGNRFIVALGGVAVFLILLKNKSYFQLSILAVLGVPVIWFGTVFMTVRGGMHQREGVAGAFELLLEQGAATNATPTMFLVNAFEGINLNVLVAVLRDFPDRMAFLMGSSLIKPFVFWVPRSVWSEKPLRVSQVLGMEYAGDEYLSLVSSFVGEIWANFGPFFILFWYFLAFVSIRWMFLIFRGYEFGPLLAFFYAFTLARSSFAGIMIETMCAAALLVLVRQLLRLRPVL
jgi:hypothetical protein